LIEHLASRERNLKDIEIMFANKQLKTSEYVNLKKYYTDDINETNEKREKEINNENFKVYSTKNWEKYKLTTDEERLRYTNVFNNDDMMRLLEFKTKDTNMVEMNTNESLINNMKGINGKVLFKKALQIVLNCDETNYQDLDLDKLQNEKYDVKGFSINEKHLYQIRKSKPYPNNKLSLFKMYKNLIDKEFGEVITSSIRKCNIKENYDFRKVNIIDKQKLQLITDLINRQKNDNIDDEYF
jgi:hypothetical protein